MWQIHITAWVMTVLLEVKGIVSFKRFIKYYICFILFQRCWNQMTPNTYTFIYNGNIMLLFFLQMYIILYFCLLVQMFACVSVCNVYQPSWLRRG